MGCPWNRRVPAGLPKICATIIFGQLIDRAGDSRFARHATQPKDDEKREEAPEAHRTARKVSHGKPSFQRSGDHRRAAALARRCERTDHRHHRHRHPGYHDQYGNDRHRHSRVEAVREAPAERRKVRQHQVSARVEQLHIGPARHQRHDGEQAAYRDDGRLSARGEWVHVPKQPREQGTTDRGCRL